MILQLIFSVICLILVVQTNLYYQQFLQAKGGIDNLPRCAQVFIMPSLNKISYAQVVWLGRVEVEGKITRLGLRKNNLFWKIGQNVMTEFKHVFQDHVHIYIQRNGHYHCKFFFVLFFNTFWGSSICRWCIQSIYSSFETQVPVEKDYAEFCMNAANSQLTRF